MDNRKPARKAPRDAGIAELRRRLAEAEQTIQALTAQQVDAVILADRGTPLLLRQAQEALRHSESRQRLLLEQLPAVVWTTDRDLRVTSAAGAALPALGLPDPLPGTSLLDLPLGSGDLARLLAVHREALEGRPGSLEIGWAGRVFQSYVEPLRDAAGQIVGCVGVALDITARQQAEADVEVARQELVERVKELTVLHRVSRLLQDERRTLSEVLSEVVALLPSGWRYSEGTAARLGLDGQEYMTPNFVPTPWTMRAERVDSHGRHLRIEVCYLEERPAAQEGPFLAEERSLLNSVAEMLMGYLERREAEAALRRAHADLERRVRERTAELDQANACLQEEIQRRAAAEGALQDERDFANAVLDTAGALIVVLDREGRIVRFNRACERLTGYGFSEAAGRPFWEFLLLPEEAAGVRAGFDTLLAGEFPNSFENYWLDRQGGRHLVAWANTALVDARGEVEHLVAIGIDVTAQREAQAQLQVNIEELQVADEELRQQNEELLAARHALEQERQRYGELFDFAPDGYLVTDAQGLIQEANRAAGALLGVEARFLAGKPLSIYVDERSRSPFRGQLQQLQNGGTGDAARWEMLVRPRDRAPFPAEVTVASVQGTGGNGGGLRWLLRDVSARKRAEEEIRSLARFPEENPNPVLRLSREGGILYANVPAQALLSIGPGDFGSAAPSPWRELAREAFAHAATRHSDVEIDGRSYSVVVVPIADAGYANLYARDITGRKQAEDALRVSLTKYRVLFESFPLGITISDRDGNIVETNRESERLLGLPPAEQVLRTLSGPGWQLVRPDGSPMPSDEYASVRALQEKRLVENVEMGMLKPGGETTWLNVTAAPIPLEGYGVAVAYGDVTAQKRAEDALRWSARRHEVISHTAARLLQSDDPQGLVEDLCREVMDLLGCQVFFNYLADEQTGRLHLNACAGIPKKEARKIEWLDYGTAVCGCVARDGERIIAEDIQNTVDPRTALVQSYGVQAYCCHPLMVQQRLVGTLSFGTRLRPRFAAAEIEVMATVADLVAMAMSRLETETALRASEERLREAKDQLELRVVERTAELVEVNRALQQEVAERQRAEASAVAERKRFNDVLETLPAYVVLLTLDYHATFANRVFRERFGEAHGRRCYEFLFHRTTPCEICETYRVLDTRAPHHWEWTGPDGRNYDVYDFPFTDNDGSALILEMGIDITERKRAEEALKEVNETLERRVAGRTAELRETRDYLDNLLTYANAPIIVWDPDFRITRFNSAFERLTGLPAEQALGRTLDILFPEERKEEALGYIRRALTGERLEVVEIPIRHVDGMVRTLLWNSATLYAVDGTTPVATIAQGQDITERKLAEQEREQRAARLATLVQASQQVLAETTAAGLLQRVVKAACELTGARVGTAGHGYHDGSFEIGAAWHMAGAPSCPPGEVLAAVERGGVYLEIVERGHAIRLTAEELVRHPAWWGLPAGHVPLHGLLGVPLPGADEPSRGLLMVSDKEDGDFSAEDEALLTQLATVASLGLRHIQARTDAERRAEELDAVFAGIADGVIVYNAAGTIVQSNPKAMAMLGMNPQGQDRMEVIGRIRIYGADGRPITREQLPSTRALRGETFLNQRYRMVNAMGQDVPMLVSAAPLYENGQVAGAVAVWNDITERDQLLDQVQQRAAELDATIAAIADGVVIYGTQGEIVHINALARELLGYREEEFPLSMAERIAPLGIHLASGTPLARVEEWPPYQALQGHMVRNAALSWQVDPDEPLLMVLISAAPIHGVEGQLLGAVATFTDVSELRAIQQQLEQVNIELAQQAEKLERRNRNLRLLNRLSQELGAALELSELLDRISRAARDTFPTDGSIIWLQDPAQKENLVCCAASYQGVEQCAPGMHVRSGEGLAGWVGQQRQSALVNRAREDPRVLASVDVPGGLPAGAVLAAPMIAHEEVLGVLEVVHQEEGGFDAESLILVETLAAAAAIALENIHLHEQAREAAVLGERSRLARELHDAVSQTLFSASVIAEALPRLWERKPERVRQGLEQLQQLTRGALSEMRTLLLELRPTALAEGKMPDLLQQLADAFSSRSRVSVTLAVDSPRSYPPNVQIALYRIAQEALNNISKHARATQVEISLRDLGPRIELRVRDNGRGFDPQHVPPDRLGLGILRERAEAIGATLEISSQVGAGTEITVAWSATQGGSNA